METKLRERSRTSGAGVLREDFMKMNLKMAFERFTGLLQAEQNKGILGGQGTNKSGNGHGVAGLWRGAALAEWRAAMTIEKAN